MISCQEMEDKGFICPCNKSIHRRDYGILSFMWFFPLHFNTQTHKTQRNKVTLTFCYGVVKQRNHCVFTQTQLLSGKHKRGSRWQQQGARWALSHSSSRITRACYVLSHRQPQEMLFKNIKSNQTQQTWACQVLHITKLCHFTAGCLRRSK